MKMVGLFLAAGLVVISLPARAQSLTEISQFAQSICSDIPEGSMTKTVIKDRLQANLEGVARLFVGSGSGQLTHEQKQAIYQGIPLDNLPDHIPTEAMCKSDLAKVLLQRKVSIINSPGQTVTAPGGVAVGRDVNHSPITIGNPPPPSGK